MIYLHNVKNCLVSRFVTATILLGEAFADQEGTGTRKIKSAPCTPSMLNATNDESVKKNVTNSKNALSHLSLRMRDETGGDPGIFIEEQIDELATTHQLIQEQGSDDDKKLIEGTIDNATVSYLKANPTNFPNRSEITL
ncbi:hypothetical protein U1Q18_042315 [Sarracenia purpurea var. burkii]